MSDITVLTVSEVAKLVRKSTVWVYQHAEEIPGHFRLGKGHAFDKDVLVDTIKMLAMQRYGQPAMPLGPVEVPRPKEISFSKKPEELRNATPD